MTMQILLLLSMAVAKATALSTVSQAKNLPNAIHQQKDRPLLQQFGRGINERVINSKEGYNRFGSGDHYTSAETIPCLHMQSSDCASDVSCNNLFTSSRIDIRRAYTADENIVDGMAGEGVHGRSSGSGCCIIRLQGRDAASVRGLVDFADNFFVGVDDDSRNTDINNLGVFRIGNNIHAGFDNNVDEEGKMQVLYTKLIPGENNEENPLLLPLEVGELVGSNSLNRAQNGMSTLIDIGSQITSAVLGMDSESTNKLLDDCKRVENFQQHEMVSDNADKIADNVSNSYQRIIRYLKPQSAAAAETDAAFWPHVDSTFLTLIPMPEIAGLEVWCPSSMNGESEDLAERGEWVRPIKPTKDGASTASNSGDNNDDCIHVVALAGEFLQLLSDGQVPTCIHRVIAPKPPLPSEFGLPPKKYVPRVSAPLFLRPRRGDDAIFDIESNFKDSGKRGLYFEEGLLAECDSMRVWDYMSCMSPNN